MTHKVAVIPARGASARIQRKNIRVFHGKPIMVYSIEAAKASELFKHIIVSTDDEEIFAIAKAHGAEAQLRPAHLCGEPDVGTQEVARYVLKTIDCDSACVIYPCAPLLTAEDLRYGYSWLSEAYPFAYIHGWYYFGQRKAFMDRVPLERGMPVEPPDRAIDIDVESDWLRAERMYAESACA